MSISNSLEYRTYKVCGLYVVAFCESAYICMVFDKVCTQDMCYDEIKLCAQNLLTVLGLIMNTTGGVEGGGQRRRFSTWTLATFACCETPNHLY